MAPGVTTLSIHDMSYGLDMRRAMLIGDHLYTRTVGTLGTAQTA
jgi:hypothetical protein